MRRTPMKTKCGMFMVLVSVCFAEEIASEAAIQVSATAMSYVLRGVTDSGKSIFVEIKGADAQEVVSRVKIRPNGSLIKLGNNTKSENGRLIDRDSKELCSYLALTVVSATRESSVVKVLWRGPSLDFSVSRITMKKKGDEWSVAEYVFEVIP